MKCKIWDFLGNSTLFCHLKKYFFSPKFSFSFSVFLIFHTRKYFPSLNTFFIFPLHSSSPLQIYIFLLQIFPFFSPFLISFAFQIFSFTKCFPPFSSPSFFSSKRPKIQDLWITIKNQFADLSWPFGLVLIKCTWDGAMMVKYYFLKLKQQMQMYSWEKC